MLRQLGRQHGGKIAAGNDVRGLQVVGCGVDDVPAEAVGAEPLVDHALGLATMYPEVAQLQEALQIEAVAQQRMLAA